MRIELHNIKHSEPDSQETLCFEAKVYIDGSFAGTAHNDGQGGATRISPNECRERLEAHAATLPPRECKLGSYQFTTRVTAEMLLDDLLVRHLQEKSLREYLDMDILFTLKDEPGIRRMKNMTIHGFDAHPKVRLLDVDKVLNRLPFEEALDLYKTAINAAE